MVNSHWAGVACQSDSQTGLSVVTQEARLTATRRSIRLTFRSITPSMLPSFLLIRATSDWQHMPATCGTNARGG